MDEQLSALIGGVRADTRGFESDVARMRDSLEGALGDAADRAGRRVEGALLRAVRTGRLGFEDLKRTALGVLDEIAAAAIRTGLDAILGGRGQGAGGGGGNGGLLNAGAQILTAVLGLPGRATGGPVSPGRAFVVGERGPELFVPTSSGRIETGGGGRTVRVSINVNAPSGSAPQALARSSRQIARAVRSALDES